MRMTIQALEQQGLVELDKESCTAIIDDKLLQAALAQLGNDEDDGILEVDDAAVGLAMKPSSFNWRRLDRQTLESMEELLVTLHSPVLQIMTPTALNPIVPALKPIAQAQRAYDQWKRAEAKRESDEQARSELARQAQECLMEQQEKSEIWMNDWGFYDGRNFYLRCHAATPTKGNVAGVEFAQSMGKIMLRYPLTSAQLDLSQEDGGLVVEMSSWCMQVSIMRDGRATKIDALCGDLFDDIRRSMSWWTFEENTGDPSRVTLLLVLIKLRHKRWDTIWSQSVLNPRRKRAFAWGPQMQLQAPKDEEAQLMRFPQGSPQDRGDDVYLDEVTPEEFVTGIEADKEDLDFVTVLVHLDREVLDQVTSQIPFEDCFAADVGPSSLELFVRTTNGNSRVFRGDLLGHVIPEYSTWQLIQSVRRDLPANSDVKAPAYWNPALRIRLVKDLPRGFLWGAVFKPDRLVAAEFRPPREYRSPQDKEQETLKALSPPPAHVNAKQKEEPPKGLKGIGRTKARELSNDECVRHMVRRIDCSQDDEWGYILIHFEESVERAASATSTGLKDFFGVRMEEEYLEVFVRAGEQEYIVCEGFLGGQCVVTESHWDFTRLRRRPKGKVKGKGKAANQICVEGVEKGKGKSEKGILALKVTLAKVFINMNWNPVFDRQDTDEFRGEADPKDASNNSTSQRTTMDGVPFLD
jgi:hypothetical protein